MNPSTPSAGIPARDGYPLGAEIVYGADGRRSSRIVVMNTAMGVPGRFYRPFARALAEAGMDLSSVSTIRVMLTSPICQRCTGWPPPFLAHIIDSRIADNTSPAGLHWLSLTLRSSANPDL